MRLSFKRLACAVAAAISLSAMATASSAADVYRFQDDNIDFVLREVNGVLTPQVSGPLNIGDVFVSVFETNITKNGVNVMPSGKELTGIAAIELKEICSSISAAGVCTPATLDPITNSYAIGTIFVYDPYAGGLNAILALGTGADPTVTGGAAGEKAMLAMWFNNEPTTQPGDPAADRDLQIAGDAAKNCTSLADCITQGSLGDLWQVDGFTGDAEERWRAVQVAEGGSDLGAVLVADEATPIASITAYLGNFFQAGGLTVGYQNIVTGVECVGVNANALDGCIQVKFTGPLLGGAGLTDTGLSGIGAVAHSDFDGRKLLVPEPASLALMGIALAGLGAIRRRRS